jgi:restriction system protein
VAFPLRSSHTNPTLLVVYVRPFERHDLATAKARVTTQQDDESCLEIVLGRSQYRNVSVTKRSGDGGIDGYGDFQQGVVSIKSAFQAKRWAESPVRRPEIDKLRGAIQGDFDHGVFLTTSRFTRDATDASYKKGAITILLLDGDAIAELMMESAIGVVRQPLYLYEIDSEFFVFDSADGKED